ncbi:MAG TPA: ribonuclease III [Deltaproteobacteria bacterium]|nr:ribonuclease III [Deltaproteobacteria bacterium]
MEDKKTTAQRREELLAGLEQRLGVRFEDRALLNQAFTHRSYLNESDDEELECNERLEFLGDAVLSCVVSRLLYERFADVDEGELTRLRARLVNKRMLAELARRLELGSCLLLGRGERLSQGMKNPTLLANVFEAVVAAVYLEKGFDGAFDFIVRHFDGLFQEAASELVHFDWKPRLQELSQRLFGTQPSYRVVSEEGPAHERIFEVEVKVGERVLGRAASRRKKDAEQLAARQAVAAIDKGREKPA